MEKVKVGGAEAQGVGNDEGQLDWDSLKEIPMQLDKKAEESGYCFDEKIYLDELKKIFREDEIPQVLLEHSDKMLRYWNEQSEKIGADALGVYLRCFRDDQDAVKYDQMRRAESFDADGLPNPEVFKKGSDFMKNSLGVIGGSNNDEAVIKFLQENVDRLEDPIDRFLVASSANLEFSDDAWKRGCQYDKFRHFARRVKEEIAKSEGYSEEAFWAAALFDDVEIAKMYNEWEPHFSLSQLTFLDMEQKKKGDILSYAQNKSFRHGGICMAASLVNKVLDTDGKLSQDFLRQPIIGDYRAEDLLKDFPDQWDGLSQKEVEYLKLDTSKRINISGDIVLEVGRRLPPSVKQSSDEEKAYRQDMLVKILNSEDNGAEILGNLAVNCGKYDLIPDISALSQECQQALKIYEGIDEDKKKEQQIFRDIVGMVGAENLTSERIGNIEFMAKRAAEMKFVKFEEIDEETKLKLVDAGDIIQEFDICESMKLIGKGYFDQVKDGLILPIKYQRVFEEYNRIDDEEKKRNYADFVSKCNLENLSEDVIGGIKALADKVAMSNAIELRRANSGLLQVLEVDGWEKGFEEIEEIFLHNNLPYVGKVFKTFQILHPADKEFGLANKESGFDLRGAYKRGALENLPNQGLISREAVIFTDLIKTSIDSNSRSMRAWIKGMREGNEKYLMTAYKQTQEGRKNPNGGFETTKRYSQADRAVRSFGYLLGLKGLDDLERRMDGKVAEADKRGRERFERNDFKIEKGDLVKAVKEEYIGDILNNGVVCKEFLNGEVSSDSTPLDADLTRIGDGVDGSIRGGIEWKNRHASFGKMRVNLVMKDNERFVTEDEEKQEGYNAERLGLWANGSSDYGIRVGFPSSVIDFITFDSQSTMGDDKSFLFQEIAKNGFYIPVVDQNSGECIFAPEDFDDLRRKLSGLEVYGGGEYQFAADSVLVDKEIGEIAKRSMENDEIVEQQREAIDAELAEILAENYDGFRGLKTEVNGDLTPGFFELIDTGSTGRGTSVPGGKIDFDFIMRIDGPIFNNAEKKRDLEDMLRKKLHFTKDKSTGNGLRLAGVTIPGIDDLVDIDISLVQRTNKMEFSTDMAVKERLQKMFEQDPARAQIVIANIVKAKEVLKAADAYKPKHSSDTLDSSKKGGLGGVGVENWILQNGGSFKIAAQEFLSVANKVGEDFEKFKAEYSVWDAGQNHFSVRDNEQNLEKIDGARRKYQVPYDNFVTRNMTEGGFKRMVVALKEYLAS